MSRDAIVKAYQATPQYKLEKLLAEESKWKRKLTIASNKLAAVRDNINKFAADQLPKQKGAQ